MSLCLGLMACGNDEEEDIVPTTTNNTENSNIQQTQDPEGTITINMTSGSSNNFYDIGLDDVKIHIDANNNFETSIVSKRVSSYPSGGYSDYDYYVEFASCGKMNGLKDVVYYPTAGWSKSLIVIPGTGYVARVMSKFHNSTSEIFFEGRYTRLYVVEQNATTGTIVKYQTPFEVPFTLEKTSVELSHVVTSPSYPPGPSYLTGTTETVKISNGTRDIKVAEKPEWCSVAIRYDGNASISASKNPNSQPRTGKIVLKNSVCSASMTVTQDVAPAE